MAFRLQRRDIFFVIIVVAAISIPAALSYFGKHPPAVARVCDVSKERGDTSQRDRRVSCLVCHDPEKGAVAERRLRANHPQKWMDEKFACTGCHRVPKAKPAAVVPSVPVH
jgi:hypothetical protein